MAHVKVDELPSDEAAVQPKQPAVPASASMRPTPVVAEPGPATSPRFARVRGERPDAYSYVRPEIRRILVMAGVVLVTLVVLSILI